MEMTSLIARVVQLEEQMLLVEEAQTRSKRQLIRMEDHLDALVREGKTLSNTQRSRSRRPRDRQKKTTVPRPEAWLCGNSSVSSAAESSSSRTPPAAVADDTSSHGAPSHRETDEQTRVQAKLLRESLLREGYGTSLLKVFAVVNDEHDARLNLQEDVAHIRSAIEGMKRSLLDDSISQPIPDKIRSRRYPPDHGPTETPVTNMGSGCSTDSSDEEAEASTGDPLPNGPDAQLDQLRVGLGVTARSSADHAGQEVFSTPPLRQSSHTGESGSQRSDCPTGD